MEYGYILKSLREEKNIRQIDIANVLNISRKTYSKYETGELILPIRHINSLCNYFNISVDYLFGFTNKTNYQKNYKEIDVIKAGDRLKNWRKENKITQEQLAKVCHTTYSNIRFFEKGRNLISTYFLYALCIKYKISADYILGRIDKPIKLKIETIEKKY